MIAAQGVGQGHIEGFDGLRTLCAYAVLPVFQGLAGLTGGGRLGLDDHFMAHGTGLCQTDKEEQGHDEGQPGSQGAEQDVSLPHKGAFHHAKGRVILIDVDRIYGDARHLQSQFAA